ncbi:glycosyltransferase [Myxococcota bacterium]|nr:glycosyltransferase [Myxococcota bacterium]
MELTHSILYVGTASGTCLQRASALADLGHHVDFIESEEPSRGDWRFPIYWAGNRIRRPPDVFRTNAKIMSKLAEAPLDIVWIDKGRSIRPSTLDRLRAVHPGTRLVLYSPDDMFNPANHSFRYSRSIPAYDLHVTTKSFNVPELYEAGAQRVLQVDKGFDPQTHRPLDLSQDEFQQYSADVGFIGAYEEEMGDLLFGLAEAGIRVVVWGVYWERYSRRHPNLILENRWLHGLEYTKAINATRINLGLLRKASRDLHTARSIEIPACGGFLLAPRTDEHMRLFEEGREAQFFGSFEELLAKCRTYLADDESRKIIAEAGHQRCLRDNYDNASRLQMVLNTIGRT